MKGMFIAGILLIVFGLISLTYQGFTYQTERKIIDVGPIKATTKEDKTVPLPPIVGGLALAGGAVLIVMSRRSI
jgi:hypothetical protein